MNRKLNAYFEGKKEYGPIFIRIITGFHLIYGVQDNVFHWDRMLEFSAFLKAFHFPLPLMCAVVSVYAQLICGILFVIGAFSRFAAIVMIVNFVVAIAMIHTADPYPQMFPALMMLCSSLFLLIHGPGRLSLDKY